MNGETFKAYVEQFLAPTSKRGDIVFMDNVSVHKVDGVEDAIEARGAIPFYLPAYSPDFNPIEQLFSKLKAMLRKIAAYSLKNSAFTIDSLCKAVATCLGFDGRRCTGVAFRRNGHVDRVAAAREVVLCGGTVNSPHLLQVSGIGPAAYLKSIGVPIVLDLPGVGANLSDHFAARISHRVKDEVSVNQLARGARLVREIGRYAATGRGALTFGVTTAMVFCRSREGLASPDLQLLFTPGSYHPSGYGRLEREPGMTIAVCLARPDSRGTIMARSADPLERPAIRPNYLWASMDVSVLLAGIDHARRIFAAPALRQYSAAETMPGADIRSEQQLNDFLHRDGTNLHHPVGTCRMGEDPMAVVDSRLRVRGVGGLRVIDASVMPAVTTGNTNAPTIMIGEKGAAMIREDAQAA